MHAGSAAAGTPACPPRCAVRGPVEPSWGSSKLLDIYLRFAYCIIFFVMLTFCVALTAFVGLLGELARILALLARVTVISVYPFVGKIKQI